MNLLKLKTWSQRQQVIAIILMAGAVIFTLAFFLLTPMNTRRNRLQGEIDSLLSELSQKNLLLGEATLEGIEKQEHARNRLLHEEWVSVASRLGAFTNRQGLADSHVGHIDFKVALFDAQKRLKKKSKALKILLPDGLGMDAAVLSNEDARKRMLQLRTVEKLVDLALDLKINMLKSIVPLDPVRHKAVNRDEAFLEEYPVRVEFYGSLQNLYGLFHALLHSDQIFALRRLLVETASRNNPELLRVDAVMSSILFLKDPMDLAPEPAKAVRPSGPMGH